MVIIVMKTCALTFQDKSKRTAMVKAMIMFIKDVELTAIIFEMEMVRMRRRHHGSVLVDRPTQLFYTNLKDTAGQYARSLPYPTAQPSELYRQAEQYSRGRAVHWNAREANQICVERKQDAVTYHPILRTTPHKPTKSSQASNVLSQ